MTYLHRWCSITTDFSANKGARENFQKRAAGMSESQRTAIGRLDEQLNAVKERL
ncbi:MAG: hypothetical protein ACYDCA_05755 [Candidatus Tyrphobacter sp.]